MANVVATLYVLECANGRYYVGKTTKTPEHRFAEHLMGLGSEWTKRNNPLRLDHTRPDTFFGEDSLTLEYMTKYGVDQVRGGKWMHVELSSAQREEIELSLRHEKELCLKCGSNTHFANKCGVQTPAKRFTKTTPRAPAPLVPKTTPPVPTAKRVATKKRALKTTEIVVKTPPPKRTRASATTLCYRCGREGHFKDACYAKTHSDGRFIGENEALYASFSDSDDYVCARCGRDSHSANECYAKTSVLGGSI
jgi:predicted GIY-YIG superfamily endonuclease